MDVFTLGASTLSIPVLLPIIKRLFAIPGDDTVDPTGPKIIWSHKLRGFREGYIPGYRRHDNPLETDLGLDALRMHYLVGKEVLISAKTKFQHVDVYEVINPRVNSLARHEGSPSNDGSYESHNPGSHGPDRILYLDGVQQSSLYGDAAYHEALVHPSMLVHPNPRRVAIIGGGEGATLREVLKHNTVEEVVMVEIDEELVALCREHLPEWSDCTDHGGSDATSCFDDSRVTVSFEDAFAWFVESFGGAKGRRERFDVIIMDALDPDHYVEIVGALYRDDQFVSSIYQGLTKEGVVSCCYYVGTCFRMSSYDNAFAHSQFVVQMGQANESDDSSLEIGTTKDSAAMASDKVKERTFFVRRCKKSHFTRQITILFFSDSDTRKCGISEHARI
jgi:spermidine synthase